MKKVLSLALILFLVSAPVAFAKQPAPAKSALSVPMSGTFVDAVGVGVFLGTFRIVRFEAVGNQLFANGYLTGTLTSAAGAPLGSVMKSVSVPVELDSGSTGRGRIATNATCDILHLVLGPLDLDLLGLVVDLNQVVLDIDAVSGAGNLLGNLLCAVVNLLNGGGPLSGIADLLNQILDILGDLLG